MINDKTYTMVEPSMVSLGECYNKFTCTLIASVYSYTSISETLRIHQSHQLEKKIRLGFRLSASSSAGR